MMVRTVEGIAFVQSHTMHFPTSLVFAHALLSIYDTTLTLMTPPLAQHYPYQLGKLLLNLQSPHQCDFLCNATPFLLSKL